MMYCLERSEPHMVKTEMTKNRTCQTTRWKQVALSEDLEALKELKQEHMRIINWDNLEVIVDAKLIYK